MNKAELIAAVAEKTGLSKKDSEKAVNAAFDTIVETLVSGKRFRWLASAFLMLRSAAFVSAVTPRLAKRSRSLQARFPSSRQVKRSRTQ